MALLATAVGCGGQSDMPGSTDTGNPPVIISQSLRLTASEAGVVVSGEPGAVPAGARVDVTNLSTGEDQTTTAGQDGSFEVELEGSVMDEYRIDVTAGGQSSRARLNASGATEPEVGLTGLEFLLESAEGYVPVEGTTVRLAFEASALRFDAGCNTHSGPYSLCNGRLCVSELSSTAIGCEPALHEQDAWVAAFLTSTPALTQTGTRLVLEGGEATLEFLDREVADADRPLTGRTWTIDTLIEGATASNVPTEALPSVVFQADGTLQVSTTCGSGSGTYVVSDQDLILSNMDYPLPEVPCPPSGSETVQSQVIQVLTDGSVSFEIEAARLTLLRGSVGLSATTD